MTTKIGIQGDEKRLNKARKKYRSLANNKKLLWEKLRAKRQKTLFVMTWEDSMTNLSFVLKIVKRKAPKIIAQEITPATRKGRRDVFILSEDNEQFYSVFYETLEELRKQYA